MKKIIALSVLLLLLMSTFTAAEERTAVNKQKLRDSIFAENNVVWEASSEDPPYPNVPYKVSVTMNGEAKEATLILIGSEWTYATFDGTTWVDVYVEGSYQYEVLRENPPQVDVELDTGSAGDVGDSGSTTTSSSTSARTIERELRQGKITIEQAHQKMDALAKAEKKKIGYSEKDVQELEELDQERKTAQKEVRLLEKQQEDLQKKVNDAQTKVTELTKSSSTATDDQKEAAQDQLKQAKENLEDFDKDALADAQKELTEMNGEYDSEKGKLGDTSLRQAKRELQKVKELEDKAQSLSYKTTWYDSLKEDDVGSWFAGERLTQKNGKYVLERTELADIGGGLGIFASKLGSYQALSNLLFPEVTQSWIEAANTPWLNAWANLPSYAATHGLAVIDACSYDDAKRTEIPGSSTTFVRTPSNTYQAVASIQAERSVSSVPILCRQNSDPAAEQEWICSKGQVCVDDSFCYKDENNDGEADSDKPVEGYFYKITWGVVAPRDEKQTPFVDENRKAVRFNIQLLGDGEVWLYQRDGLADSSVIALANGEADQNIILHYSARKFTHACIRYDPAHPIKDADGDLIEDQCPEFVESAAGSIEFRDSERQELVSTKSADVTVNSDW